MRLSLLLGWIGLALPLSGQGNVLTVDRDGSSMPDFTQLQPAINAAAEGDVILVKEGVYSGAFIDGKSLTVQAEAGATVVTTTITIRHLAASQSTRLRGMTLSGVGYPGLLLYDNSGVIWI